MDRRGHMVIKLDLNKTYGRLKWVFFENIDKIIGFSWIMDINCKEMSLLLFYFVKWRTKGIYLSHEGFEIKSSLSLSLSPTCICIGCELKKACMEWSVADEFQKLLTFSLQMTILCSAQHLPSMDKYIEI